MPVRQELNPGFHGAVALSRCERENGHYFGHLSDVKRLDKQRKPKRMPQPVWFRPF